MFLLFVFFLETPLLFSEFSKEYTLQLIYHHIKKNFYLAIDQSDLICWMLAKKSFFSIYILHFVGCKQHPYNFQNLYLCNSSVITLDIRIPSDYDHGLFTMVKLRLVIHIIN